MSPLDVSDHVAKYGVRERLICIKYHSEQCVESILFEWIEILPKLVDC